MKALFTTLFCALLFTVVTAQQQPKLYEAKVYTSSGITKGVLERVYQHGVGIIKDNDVAYIDASEISKIEVKRFSYSFGKKLLGAALIGSMLAVNSSVKANDEIRDNIGNPAYPDHTPYSLTDQGSFALTGAALGGLVGAAIPPPRKKASFDIQQNRDAFYKVFVEFSQYGRYNQTLASATEPLPPLK